MADALIVFPDPVGVTIDYLRPVLAANGEDCPIHKTVPRKRPSRFVQVFRTGGPRSNVVVDAAQLTISCWADNAADAADLTSLTRGALEQVRSTVVDGAVTFYKVDELAGPVDLPDPQSNQARMTWSVLAYMRGVPIPVSSGWGHGGWGDGPWGDVPADDGWGHSGWGEGPWGGSS